MNELKSVVGVFSLEKSFGSGYSQVAIPILKWLLPWGVQHYGRTPWQPSLSWQLPLSSVVLLPLENLWSSLSKFPIMCVTVSINFQASL